MRVNDVSSNGMFGLGAVPGNEGGYLPRQNIFGLGQERLFGLPSGMPPGVRKPYGSAFFGLGQENLFGLPSGMPPGVRKSYGSAFFGLGQAVAPTTGAGQVAALSLGLLIGGFVGAIIGQIGASLGSKVVPLEIKMRR